MKHFLFQFVFVSLCVAGHTVGQDANAPSDEAAVLPFRRGSLGDFQAAGVKVEGAFIGIPRHS